MEIRDIAVFRIELQAAGGVYKLSGGREFRNYDSTIVRVTADDGQAGWGESCPFGIGYLPGHAGRIRAGIALLAPYLIGLDPRRVERIYEVMDTVLPGNQDAKSAIDLACWDLFGRASGLPVCELLGGRADVDLPLISSVSTGTPEEMAAKVEAFRAEGYLAHSVKVGGARPEEDLARIGAIMAARKPGESYLVDVNRGWTLDTALSVARGLKDWDIAVEQPCNTYRECLSFKRRTDLPLSLDEILDSPEMLLQAIADDALDVANIKLGKVGGLTKARRMRDICATAGIAVSVQETCGSDIAFAAICHLAQSTPDNVRRHIWDCRELAGTKTAEGAPAAKAGHARATDAPGLGIEPLVEVLGEPVAVYT